MKIHVNAIPSPAELADGTCAEPINRVMTGCASWDDHDFDWSKQRSVADFRQRNEVD